MSSNGDFNRMIREAARSKPREDSFWRQLTQSMVRKPTPNKPFTWRAISKASSGQSGGLKTRRRTMKALDELLALQRARDLRLRNQQLEVQDLEARAKDAQQRVTAISRLTGAPLHRRHCLRRRVLTINSRRPGSGSRPFRRQPRSLHGRDHSQKGCSSKPPARPKSLMKSSMQLRLYLMRSWWSTSRLLRLVRAYRAASSESGRTWTGYSTFIPEAASTGRKCSANDL